MQSEGRRSHRVCTPAVSPTSRRQTDRLWQMRVYRLQGGTRSPDLYCGGLTVSRHSTPSGAKHTTLFITYLVPLQHRQFVTVRLPVTKKGCSR